MARDKEADKGAEMAARASFAERLLKAFKIAKRLQPNGKPDRAWLSEQTGISVQAIGQALNADKPIVFSAYTNAKASRALGVNSHWLATGEETPEAQRAELPLSAPQSPAEMGNFVGQLVTLFTRLSPDLRHDLLTHANNLVNLGNTTPNAGDPFAGKRPPKGANTRTRQKPMLIKELSRADDMLIEWLPADKVPDEGGKKP